MNACHIYKRRVLTIFFGNTGFKFYMFSPKALLTKGLFYYNANCLNIFLNYY